MERVIYSFSGTGNSLRAALRIAEGIGGADVVNIRGGTEDALACTADVVGFVCPVYEWDLPGTMKDFVRCLNIRPDAYVFLVATHIFIHGRAFESMQSLLEAKGARLAYGYALRCVASQCTAYPPFPPERWMIPYTERRLGRIAREIAERKARPYPRMGRLTRALYPRLMTPYMQVEKEYDKGFFTDERCVGCGLCAKVCPTRNIALPDGRPVWNHRCHGCMACVAYCPRKAIQFQTPEAYKRLNRFISKRLCLPENRKRYHHPYIQAADLMTERRYVPGKEDQDGLYRAKRTDAGL